MVKRCVFIVCTLVAISVAANAGEPWTGLKLSEDGGTFTWTITPSADALVDQLNMTTNYGTVNRLETLPPRSLTPFEGEKSYIRFGLPTSEVYGNAASYLTAATVVGASLRLTAQVDCNDFNSDGNNGGSLRLWALKESYDTWVESGNPGLDGNVITYTSALSKFGSVSKDAPSGNKKYFIKSGGSWNPGNTNNDIEYAYNANYLDPADPNKSVTSSLLPGMEVLRGFWVDSAHMATVRTVTWDLLNATGRDANGAYTQSVNLSGGGWDPNTNQKGVMDLVQTDTDDAITLLLAANHRTYFQSREAGNEVDRPTLVIQFVPEPATLTVLGLGALGLIRRRRRS
jgi:hypothetical protein